MAKNDAAGDEGVLPPGAHPRDIFVGLALVTFAMLWAFMASLTSSEVLYQFPLLTLVAVLATGGLEAENDLHNLLASAWWKKERVYPYPGENRPIIAKNWGVWTQKWDATTARWYINEQGYGPWLRAFSVCRWIGMAMGFAGFFTLPFLLAGITSFRSTSTETDTGISDTAPLGNGLLALCGAGNCSGLSPSSVDAFDISGDWTRQFLWCEDTASIECEEPVRRLDDEGGEESAIAFVLEVERNEDTETDRLRSLSLQIVDSNGTEEVGIIANDTIDGLWWTMNDDWTYVKIRWSPNDGTYFNESWHNEDVFFFSGLTSVETVPSSTTPVCFSEELKQEFEEIDANKRTGFIHHSLSETAAREILRSSYLNTFFTKGITGNPYRSVHTADRVHVVGAGEFSWETEKKTTSEFFTEQLWEGDDKLTMDFLTLVFSFLVYCALHEEYFSAADNPRNVGVFAMAGSLVGRIAFVLIMAEGSVFLAKSSRGSDLSKGDAWDAAVAALVYKYGSWVLLLTVIVGDGICAPRCWFTK